jgi:hypothetical protein
MDQTCIKTKKTNEGKHSEWLKALFLISCPHLNWIVPSFRLLALPEVEREQILSERSEERQRNLERLEVRKLLKDGRKDDSKRSKHHGNIRTRYCHRVSNTLSFKDPRAPRIQVRLVL